MIYFLMSALIFGMNVIPAFMPPTWVILAFFYSHFHLNLYTTVLLGAASATFGRVVLYYLSKKYLRNIFPKKFNDNYDGLGEFIKNKQKLTIPIVVTYAFLPIPSNNVFIIAGLAKLNIKVIAISFFFGRLVSYTFWVSLAYQVTTRLGTFFENHLSNWSAISLEIGSILLVILVGQINWRGILKIKS